MAGATTYIQQLARVLKRSMDDFVFHELEIAVGLVVETSEFRGTVGFLIVSKGM